MNVGKICSRDVATCTPETSLREAAESMRARHVGSLVVVADDGGPRRPLGIVTDRDIVIEAVATGLDASTITAGDVAVGDLATATERDGVHETAHRMRSLGVRRMPVVDANGELAGIVTLDDLLHFMAGEIGTLARIADWQPRQEGRRRP